jgi:tryptophan 2,3-dioxygenase
VFDAAAAVAVVLGGGVHAARPMTRTMAVVRNIAGSSWATGWSRNEADTSWFRDAAGQISGFQQAGCPFGH